MIGAAVLASPLAFIAPAGCCCRSEACAVHPFGLKRYTGSPQAAPRAALPGTGTETRNTKSGVAGPSAALVATAGPLPQIYGIS